jgi:hypothetical protein
MRGRKRREEKRRKKRGEEGRKGNKRSSYPNWASHGTQGCGAVALTYFQNGQTIIHPLHCLSDCLDPRARSPCPVLLHPCPSSRSAP